MKRDFRARLLVLALLSLVCQSAALAAPPPPVGTPPATESKGPLRRYLYRNDDGIFELEIGGTGTAKYRWKDQRTYIDTLRFQREASFYTDDEHHKGWIYEASGSGNTWYLFFGSQSMGKDTLTGEELFPLYFSMEEPAKNRFDRWRTRSGTTRLVLP